MQMSHTTYALTYLAFPKQADVSKVAQNLRENEDPSDTNRRRITASGNSSRIDKSPFGNSR